MRDGSGWSTPRAVLVTAAPLLALSLVVPQTATGAASGATPPVSRSVIGEWMVTAGKAIEAEKGSTGPDESIWLAFVAAGMYNAVVGIEGRYEPYKWPVRGPRTASSEAAAATAAHRLLRFWFPKSADASDAAYAASLAKVPDGPAEDEGVAFGVRAAERIIALRAGDGQGVSVPVASTPRPGTWRPTPPAYEPFASAWLGRLRPLLLDSPGQFRPGPPPALASARYAAEIREVRVYGAKKGSRRSQAQTDTALFFTDLDVQKALQDYADRYRYDIVDTARLYAAVNTVRADTVITAWEAKVHYGTWRPIDAIREADSDGNPATLPDPDWEPLLPTPAHPDHLSGHAAIAGALTGTLTELFGTSRIELTITSTTARRTRHYRDAHTYDRDAVDARVWAGVHTRTADQAGNDTGRRVAAWAMRRYFRPVAPE
ncbi:vanadium-dependent haloperoxidase [Streptomyces sp. NPDC047928]|uniref:vanadium-dependent haloperoxidase n=1 Tax=unclassified Streptomyces TaxID=2593676 RepID=UPI003713081C